ncbi:hypothetical protein P9112_011584 [Eukaryota sp. TZLM1-RC]
MTQAQQPQYELSQTVANNQPVAQMPTYYKNVRDNEVMLWEGRPQVGCFEAFEFRLHRYVLTNKVLTVESGFFSKHHSAYAVSEIVSVELTVGCCSSRADLVISFTSGKSARLFSVPNVMQVYEMFEKAIAARTV